MGHFVREAAAHGLGEKPDFSSPGFADRLPQGVGESAVFGGGLLTTGLNGFRLKNLWIELASLSWSMILVSRSHEGPSTTLADRSHEMLPLKYVLKVARLMDQTGEPRPGFLHDERDNLQGESPAVEGSALHEHGRGRRNRKIKDEISVDVSLAYEVDSRTGDLRIVQK